RRAGALGRRHALTPERQTDQRRLPRRQLQRGGDQPALANVQEPRHRADDPAAVIMSRTPGSAGDWLALSRFQIWIRYSRACRLYETGTWRRVPSNPSPLARRLWAAQILA